jgi:hypothetical protein
MDLKVLGRTYQHLFIFSQLDSLALDNMDVFQSTQHLVVHLESNLGVELGPLFDCEGLVLQFLESLGATQVEGDIWFTGSLDGERFDDAFAGVFRVTNGIAGVQTQGSLPSVERLVVLICEAKNGVG